MYVINIMNFLKSLLFVSGVIGSLCFFGPRSSLHNLIQVRGVFSGLRRSVSREILDGSNIITIISNTNHLHSFDPFVFTIFGAIYWLWIRPDIHKDDKIQNLIPFYQIQRPIQISTIVFFTVMSKNIENAI